MIAFVCSVLLFSLLFFSSSPVRAISAEYQQCPVNTSCTVGEFLYADDYSPIAGATCTYTARKPDGTLFLNAVAMSESSDGWYAYSVNATGAVSGLYRGTICCTPPADAQVCLEKSFVVGPADMTATDVANAVWDATRSSHTTTGSFGENLQNATSITAADVWNYSSRTLSGFGTLASDVWANSTRTLSGFGDLVSSITSSIWGNSSRTLTSGTLSNSESLVTSSSTTQNITVTYNTISQQLTETRSLLERVINQPTIQSFIDDKPTESLESKLQKTESMLLQVQEQSTRAMNTIDLLGLTWSSVQPDQLTQKLSDTTKLLGTNPDDPHPETMLDNAHILASLWNSLVLSSLSDQTQAALVSAKSAEQQAKSSGKSSATRQSLQETSKFLTTLTQLLGTPEDAYTKPTAFGYLHDLQRKAQALHEQEQSAQNLLSDWKSIDTKNRSQLLATLSKEVFAINAIPQGIVLTTPAKVAHSPEISQKNQALGLQALISANKQLLAQNANDPLNSYWLEEGSVIFRFLLTNPSSTIRQDVPVKYYLPPEVMKEHILTIDTGLTIEYDAEKNTYFASGTYSLASQETKTISIEVEDIWVIQDSDLQAIKKQAEDLLKPLQKTSYYAQGALLKSDIDVAVDKISANQSKDRTPDARIRAYRENEIELVGIKQNMSALKNIVASASSTGSIFGFVGSVQVVAVWGIIIVLLAGLTYLALYMKALRTKIDMPENLESALQGANIPTKRYYEKPIPGWKKGVFVLLFFLLTGTITSAVSSAFLVQSDQQSTKQIASTTREEKLTVLGATTKVQRATLQGKVQPVPIYTSPSSESEMLHRIPEDIIVQIKGKKFNWIQIQYTWGAGVYIGWVQDNTLKKE
ncbi:MAG TPA: hypothetical protein DCX25_03400 [Candidatus Pacebacteria bacterium]|nr:hypothetical protein [Candidatus Paceibacterota bacterium]HCR11377.1 hypothetical protein [Candidatus Paceibacterota bacterium]